MAKMVFVTGGARSGKSSYALTLVKGPAVFVATAEALDREMKHRIAIHKRDRPASWTTIEAPRDMGEALSELDGEAKFIIIDCLTLYVSNMFMDRKSEDEILAEMNSILKSLKKIRKTVIVISNEVGLGIVPDNPLGRRFRDAAGKVNQLFASEADKVIFMVSGIPWRIK